MMSEKETPWVIGAEVIHRNGNWGKRTKIAKVYKNGNVVTEDGSQQYRPWASKGIATATGDGRRRPNIYLLTPELEATIAEDVARDRALSAARTLKK